MLIAGILTLLAFTHLSQACDNLLTVPESRENIQNCHIDLESGCKHSSAFLEASLGLDAGSAFEPLHLELCLGDRSSLQNVRTFNSKQPETDYEDCLSLTLALPTSQALHRAPVWSQLASPKGLPKWLQGIEDHDRSPPGALNPKPHFAPSVVLSEMGLNHVPLPPFQESGLGGDSKLQETPQPTSKEWPVTSNVKSTLAEVSLWSQADRDNLPTASEHATPNTVPKRQRKVSSHYPDELTGPRQDLLARSPSKIRLNTMYEPTVHDFGLGHNTSGPDISGSQEPKMLPNLQAVFPTVSLPSQALWEEMPSSSQQAITPGIPKWLQRLAVHHSPNEISEPPRDHGPSSTSPEIGSTPLTEHIAMPAGQGSKATIQYREKLDSKKPDIRFNKQQSSRTVSPSFMLASSPPPLSPKPLLWLQPDAPESHLKMLQESLALSTQPVRQKPCLSNDSLGQNILKVNLKTPAMGYHNRPPLEAGPSSLPAGGSFSPRAHQKKRKAPTHKGTPESVENWKQGHSIHSSEQNQEESLALQPAKLEDTATYRYDKYADRPHFLNNALWEYYPEEWKHRELNNMNSDVLKVPIIFSNLCCRRQYEFIQQCIYGIKKIEYGQEKRFPSWKPSPGVKYRNIWLEASQKGVEELKELNLQREFTLEPKSQLSSESEKPNSTSTPLYQNFRKTRERLQHFLPAIIHDIRVIGEAFPQISKDISIKKIQYDAYQFYNHFWNHIESIYSDQNEIVLWEMNSIMSHQELVKIIDEIEGFKGICNKTSMPKARRILALWMSVRLRDLWKEACLIRSTDKFSSVLNEFYYISEQCKSSLRFMFQPKFQVV